MSLGAYAAARVAIRKDLQRSNLQDYHAECLVEAYNELCDMEREEHGSPLPRAELSKLSMVGRIAQYGVAS